jgi:thiamine biosynthesis lipoprotein
MLAAHRRLSRFLPGSELSRLNRDPRPTVPAGELLIELAAAAREAGELTAGLVDATLLERIEAAGYRDSLPGRDGTPSPAFPAAGPPAGPSAARAWRDVSVDREAGTVTRPPGVAIDSGGIAKGLLADRVGAALRRFPAYLVNCCGDIRIGGAALRPRKVLVEDPYDGRPLHTLVVADGGVATSGITRRSWIGPGAVPAHHLLDPASGEPAFTGVIQATAIAPSALRADVFAKWALLSGPDLGPSRLPHGGVLVLAGGEVVAVAPRQPAPIAA